MFKKKKHIEEKSQKYRAYYKDFYTGKVNTYIIEDASWILPHMLNKQIDEKGNVVYIQEYLIHAEPYYEEGTK